MIADVSGGFGVPEKKKKAEKRDVTFNVFYFYVNGMEREQ